MIKQAQILIPSGKPPVDLVPSLVGAATPEIEVSEGGDLNLLEAMEGGAQTGLSDGSEALSDALSPNPKAKGSKARKGDSSAWKPEHFSDADLISWAEECRDKHGGGWLKVSALKYWLRYTFESYTPEYRALGERLEKVVK